MCKFRDVRNRPKLKGKSIFIELIFSSSIDTIQQNNIVFIIFGIDRIQQNIFIVFKITVLLIRMVYPALTRGTSYRIQVIITNLITNWTNNTFSFGKGGEVGGDKKT